MSQNGILIKNENEANRFAAKIMLISIIFVILVYILDVVGIFIVPIGTMTIAMSLAAVCLILPAIIVFGLKRQEPWVKYFIATSATLMVFIVAMFLSWHAILIFIYPLAVASLFFSRRLSWYTVIISLVLLSLAQFLSLSFGLPDNNLPAAYDMIVHGIAPRAIEFLAISFIFIMLSKRTRDMLENVMGAEEQTNILNRMVTVTNKSKDVSNVLVDSVHQLSIITNNTTKANEQIAGNTQKIASGSEDSIKFMDEAMEKVTKITGNIKRIAEEGGKIAEISQQVRQMNEDSGKAIQSAAHEMASISEATLQGKDIVARLKGRSVEIGRFVETITGISEQTNMLALNAAIESARAGEQGRGFAVVAGEIRTLAEQSRKAARDIADLIEEVAGNTEKAAEAMDTSSALVDKGLSLIRDAGNSFDRLSQFGEKMYGRIAEVSEETKEAAISSNQMVQLVDGIRDINNKNLNELQEIAAAVEEQVASMQQVSASVCSIESISNELLEVVKE